MTSLKAQNLANSVCGFMCGFFFMSFATLRGHISDVSFVAALAFVALSFALNLLQTLRRKAGDSKFNFCIGALLPMSSMFFFCLLMIASSLNTAPKPIWMVGAMAMSLGVTLTSLVATVVPKLAAQNHGRMIRR